MLLFGLLILFLLLIGATCLIIGLRGRRVGDHLYCRRCGYDLHGQPEWSTNCPECGRLTTAPHATVVGQRQRRRRPLIAGMFILLVSISIAIPVAPRVARAIDVYHYIPGVLLVQLASHGDMTALDRICDRAYRDVLWSSSWNSAVTTGLAIQCSASVSWDNRWGELIEEAHRKSHISTQDWQTYLIQSMHLELKLRSSINTGAPLVVGMKWSGGRNGYSDLLSNFTLLNCRIDQHSLPGSIEGYRLAEADGGASYTGGSPLTFDLPLSPGRHEFEATLRQRWPFPSPNVIRNHSLMMDASELHLDALNVIELKQSFTVWPASDPHPLTIVDPSKRAAERQAIRFSPELRDRRIDVEFDTSMLPISIDSDVAVYTADGQLIGTRHVYADAGSGTAWGISFDSNAVHVGDRLRVVLTAPDPAKLARRMTDDLVWGEAIESTDLTVQDARVLHAQEAFHPATRPSIP